MFPPRPSHNSSASFRRRKGPLPGDPDKREKIARMIRVDHAGEYGAVRIYRGQRAVLGKRHPLDPTLAHMEKQEQAHLQHFEALMVERRVRPTLLTPLWDMAGFALGAGTALLGVNAAMACTVAVEEAIDGHYAEQVKALDGEQEEALQETFETFRQEELEHRDIGLEHGAEQAPGYKLLYHAIQTGSRFAIWLSQRV